MVFEKLSKNKKKYFIAVLLVILLFIVGNLFMSRAKYQVSEEVDLAEGKINYPLYDLNVLAIKIDDGIEEVSADEIPKHNYKVNQEESYCIIPGSEDKQKNGITYKNGKITIDVYKKGTKCWVYLETVKNINELVESYGEVTERTEFDKIATTDEGVSFTYDDDGKSYYYRGDIDYNYVHFAGFYWRIIRVNGDGSLRIIYDGTSAHKNGESSKDRVTGNLKYNNDNTDNMYAGFMYESNQIHGTKVPSNVLGASDASDELTLNGWYKTYIVNKNLEKYINQNGTFCNDRNSSTTNISWDDWLKEHKDSGGVGSVTTYYGARLRFFSTEGLLKHKPILTCYNKADLFSKKGATKGNNALTYPIGLITADEVIYAGGYANYAGVNSKYYLYSRQNVWTMSAARTGQVIYIDYDGKLWAGSPTADYSVRPVINLDKSIIFKSGDGSIQKPFEI